MRFSVDVWSIFFLVKYLEDLEQLVDFLIKQQHSDVFLAQMTILFKGKS